MDVPGTSHEWGSVADARALLKLSKSQVHRLIKSGALESEPVPRPQGTTYRVCLRHLPDRVVSEKKPSEVAPSGDVPDTSPTRYLDIIQEQAGTITSLHEELSAALTELINLREERGTYRERAAQERARAERAEAELKDERAKTWWDKLRGR